MQPRIASSNDFGFSKSQPPNTCTPMDSKSSTFSGVFVLTVALTVYKPESMRALQTWDPRNPDPPVTQTIGFAAFMGRIMGKFRDYGTVGLGFVSGIQ